MAGHPDRAAVVGGGVLGVSTAQQLARARADVVLVTEGELVSQASGRSLSWLNSAGPYREAYHRLRMAGIDRYRTHSAQHGDLDWLRFDGGLTWTPPDRTEELHRQHGRDQAVGYDSRLVSAAEVATLVPGVDPAAVPETGALWRPGEGWVDLPGLVRFLADDLVAHGGQVVTGAGRAEVVVESGAVAGVRTARGEAYAAEAVVLAIGSATPAVLGALGVDVPDQSPLAHLVATQPVEHALTVVLNTPRVSLRPRPDGGLAVDADRTSAAIRPTPGGGFDVAPEVVEELLAEATAVLSGHPPLTAAWSGAGPKPVPGDGEPVLGRIDEVPGLHVAFTHSGATLGLIAGELLAYEVVQGRDHPLLAPFNARRFRPR